VSEETAPERITVVWSPEARADLRAIDRKTALEILHCIDHYLMNHAGDVKKLKPPLTGFRLRCGRLSRVLRRQGREDHPYHCRQAPTRSLPLIEPRPVF